ncbi:MAG: PqqD family protein [Candidatus Omnitrophica bacterium]|nr:PqqD family protein [Candidatus Omnitrophota bacterium]
MTSLTEYPVRSPETASRKIEDETVIVIPQLGLARVLNPVGSRVWELMDGRNSVAKIIEIVFSEFDADKEAIATDVLDFLNDLRDKKMAIFQNEPAN